MNRSGFAVDKNWLFDLALVRIRDTKPRIAHGAVSSRYPFHGGNDPFVRGRHLFIPCLHSNFKLKRWPSGVFCGREYLCHIDENDISVAQPIGKCGRD